MKEVTVLICSICNTAFNDNEEVVLHMVNNHQNEHNIEQILNKIPAVPIRMKASKSKRKALRIPKEYQCTHSICNYKTIHYSTFKRHLLTHEKDGRQHKCPHCSFSTIQKHNLMRHIKDVHLDGTVDVEPIIVVRTTS
ncbi:zinc finger Y-chromosomal protein 1 [Plutella xylostella]|uniref:zinc finger Y-chromosomal protein 1 n=1 Tax=Plutella xylostella TaxID=51655 RepID=UPI0020329C0E|nr:zinc finger Y-chromosomal protein 1 [Plutella xylostella]